MLRRIWLIDLAQKFQEEINGFEPRLVGHSLPFGNRFSPSRIERDSLHDRAQHGLVLRTSTRHGLMKRVEKAKCGGRPKIGYSNDVEEDEPTLRLPNTASQRTDQVRLAGAGFPQDHLAERIVRQLFRP